MIERRSCKMGPPISTGSSGALSLLICPSRSGRRLHRLNNHQLTYGSPSVEALRAASKASAPCTSPDLGGYRRVDRPGTSSGRAGTPFVGSRLATLPPYQRDRRIPACRGRWTVRTETPEVCTARQHVRRWRPNAVEAGAGEYVKEKRAGGEPALGLLTWVVARVSGAKPTAA